MERRKGQFLSSSRFNSIRNLKPRDEAQQDNDFLTGRRIVEFQILIDGLKSCKKCFESLTLSGIVGETVYGLGSILSIKCQACGAENKIPTGKRHKATNSNRADARCFDVNTKLAAAMINAGIGEQQINNVLAYINLPTISKASLKCREREIGTYIEEIASASCREAIQEEKDAILQSETQSDRELVYTPEVSADGGWQKRGNGHSNNSLSGHVTVIGKQTKKCLSFAVAKRSCRICKIANRKKKIPKKHACRRNWSGSAKAMESFLTLSCLQELKKNSFDVSRLTTDDDSTTFIKAKRSLFPDLIKQGDRNHVIKNMTSSLYQIKKSNKSLSVREINHLKKCFSYAITQNKGSPEGIKKNISCIVPHTFGLHEDCPDTWCKAKNQPDYKHSNVAGNLLDKNLKNELSSVFDKYTTPGMSKKMANLESTNINESMNQMISRKAPKNTTYSESESLDFRMSAAVAQKNEGHNYILKVNERHGLSPGKSTKKRCCVLDKKTRYNSARQQTKAQKRRRLELKGERVSGEIIYELEEGTTYETAVCSQDDIQNSQLQEIPSRLTRPKVLENQIVNEENIVVFDLETTGFGVDCNVIQLAALRLVNQETFNCYVAPPCNIPAKITTFTGLEYHAGTMYDRSIPVPSSKPQIALTKFNKWLTDQIFTQPPILVAHNVKFDSKILTKAYKKYNVVLPDIAGFSDSYMHFKKVFPGRSSYKQESLVNEILGKTYNAHNAADDCKSLAALLQETDVTKLTVSSVDEIVFTLAEIENEHKNLPSYTDAISKEIFSKSLSKTLARGGLSLQHLRLSYERSGIDGLSLLLRDRAKRSKFNIVSISEYLDNLQ